MTDLAFFNSRLVTEWGELLAKGGGGKMVVARCHSHSNSEDATGQGVH